MATHSSPPGPPPRFLRPHQVESLYGLSRPESSMSMEAASPVELVAQAERRLSGSSLPGVLTTLVGHDRTKGCLAVRNGSRRDEFYGITIETDCTHIFGLFITHHSHHWAMMEVARREPITQYHGLARARRVIGFSQTLGLADRAIELIRLEAVAVGALGFTLPATCG